MKITMGALIGARRKELGMTQLQLAEKLGVTDKAVSKWERDKSCPDIGLLGPLSETLGIPVEQLLRCGTPAPAATVRRALLPTVLKAVALAQGVAVLTLCALGQMTPAGAVPCLAIGMTCLALLQFLPQ